jgi:hypothetical protein
MLCNKIMNGPRASHIMQKCRRDKMESRPGRNGAPAVALLFYVSCCRELGVGSWDGFLVGPPSVGRVGSSRPATAWLACVMCRGSWPSPNFAVLGPARAAPPPNMWSALGAPFHQVVGNQAATQHSVLDFQPMAAHLAASPTLQPWSFFSVGRSFKYYTSMLAQKKRVTLNMVVQITGPGCQRSRSFQHLVSHNSRRHHRTQLKPSVPRF